MASGYLISILELDRRCGFNLNSVAAAQSFPSARLSEDPANTRTGGHAQQSKLELKARSEEV